ncbi:dGTP triphosphohydrolase [Occallatibacter savannae]|uniref:dGTP triphosphohydrolase n=1 Tax=Occallatibacter savannae TaxID=1002691 RepID=UPI000D691E02|nr:dNTP triphosphohydrolase [Occallatibacter savannae]
MSESPLQSFLLPQHIAVQGEGELTSRPHSEPDHPYRSSFARDRARILHARSFRRLAGKTQVFSRIAGDIPGDHFRSRLTHTLEVAQISRTIASALGLNAELAEALALAHDIGHPPFGHAGEKALDEALREHGLSFDHNLHALRIVTWFEERYPAFRGLNLTLAMREGIVKHSRDYTAASHPELADYFLDLRPPLEAQLIDIADEIAYLTADFDDGLDSAILTIDDVCNHVPLFRHFHNEVRSEFPSAPAKQVVYESLNRILNALVTDLIEEVHHRVDVTGATTLDDIRRAPDRLAMLSPAMEAERATAKLYLYANFYNSPGMEEEHDRASRVVKEIFSILTANPSLLPPDHQLQIPTEGLARTVADYIAGMTDSYIDQLWLRHCPR